MAKKAEAAGRARGGSGTEELLPIERLGRVLIENIEAALRDIKRPTKRAAARVYIAKLWRASVRAEEASPEAHTYYEVVAAALDAATSAKPLSRRPGGSKWMCERNKEGEEGPLREFTYDGDVDFRVRIVRSVLRLSFPVEEASIQNEDISEAVDHWRASDHKKCDHKKWPAVARLLKLLGFSPESRTDQEDEGDEKKAMIATIKKGVQRAKKARAPAVFAVRDEIARLRGEARVRAERELAFRESHLRHLLKK